MTERDYQICTFCVMDTSDPDIEFDADGRCNHCREVENLRGTVWFPDDEGARRLERMIESVKQEGRGKEYDCVLGISGGIDSSYLALKAYEWGIRPLVVHVDAGWNSEMAVQNIERIVKHCGYELHTHVVNWEDMRELQLSYLRAAVANQDVPQDHAFFAGLYHFATDNKVRYVLNGGNVATEGIFPMAWHAAAMDARNLKAIHRTYGTRPLTDYPLISFSQYYFWYPIVKRMTPLRPLNLMPYSKDQAVSELEEIGWRAYPRKHGESLFTKFFQNYYLPTKFGYDKRRPHLSSLVASGAITRDKAIELLQEPLYDEEELRRDRQYICRKLRISDDELRDLMNRPIHHYTDFDNWDRQYARLKWAQSGIGRITGKTVTAYR
ncbi:MAG TPA: N-acetyl sugar amidotransferase [Actinomycetota bacterium]|nr:N-acetyl sugar amidotransferase [Actinomycetota bacterium]